LEATRGDIVGDDETVWGKGKDYVQHPVILKDIVDEIIVMLILPMELTLNYIHQTKRNHTNEIDTIFFIQNL